jgi:hypothetical protein
MRFFTGAFDSQGEPIAESLIYRTQQGRERQLGFPGRLGSRRQRVKGPCIYMGVLFHHFGHFVLEGLSRMWFAKEHPDMPIVWSTYGTPRDRSTTRSSYRPWQADLVKLIGVDNPPMFVERAITFSELVIPEPGYRIQNYFHPTHRDALAVVDCEPLAGCNTWLSRSRLDPRKGGNRTEALLERRLAGAGWQIIHPEELSIKDQLAALRSSERVAGMQGSAFHNLLFLRNPEGLAVDIISRDADLPLRSENRNYQTIAKAKAIKQTIHRPEFERVIERKGPARVERIAQNSFQYLAALQVRPVANNKRRGPARTSERIRQILRVRPGESYLEIGVAGGTTFLDVDVQRKHAVGREFRFDVSQFAQPGADYFEMTTPEFFRWFADPDTRYDLVFLHGSPGWKDTLRDFSSTISHSHTGTVWLINGVVPPTLIGLSGDDATREARRLDGENIRSDDNQDLFRVVFAVRQFFPQFSYRTVIDGACSQLVLTRHPREGEGVGEEDFGDLSSVDRLRCVDLVANWSVLEEASESETVAWLAAQAHP